MIPDPVITNLREEVRKLRNEMRVRPIVTARGGAAAPTSSYQTLVIGGGNADLIGNDLEGIQFASAALTLTAAYDPEVDTVYPAGLGWGYLFRNGVQSGGKVLIRHDFGGYIAPALEGFQARPCGTTTLTYDPGDGDPIVSMVAYRFDWL